MPRFSLVLFDLDGTLVDTAHDIAGALNATLGEAGLRPLTTDSATRYIGNGAARLIERALPADVAPTEDVGALVNRFKAYYAAHLCEQSRIYPGVVDLLDRLSALTMPLAVLTNKPGDLARSLLNTLGIGAQFRHIIGDGDGFARKPAPDAARWLMEQHRVPASATLLVGDGLPDIQVAHAAGCAVAAAVWGYTPRASLLAESPTFVVDTPSALCRLLFDDFV